MSRYIQQGLKDIQSVKKKPEDFLQAVAAGLDDMDLMEGGAVDPRRSPVTGARNPKTLTEEDRAASLALIAKLRAEGDEETQRAMDKDKALQLQQGLDYLEDAPQMTPAPMSDREQADLAMPDGEVSGKDLYQGSGDDGEGNDISVEDLIGSAYPDDAEDVGGGDFSEGVKPRFDKSSLTDPTMGARQAGIPEETLATLFKTTHGGRFDANSKADRAKMNTIRDMIQEDKKLLGLSPAKFALAVYTRK